MTNIPGPGSRVHFVGIGGIGMAALAQYLLRRGVAVSGSDRSSSTTLDLLRDLGATVADCHDATNVAGVDLVVITSAATPDNVEVLAAAEQGIPVIKRAELLGSIVNSGYAVAVAGTHGKSTVSALTAHLLRFAGVDVTLFGGAFIRTDDGGIEGPSWGESDNLFVVEADEYDRSFHQLSPAWGVITGVEYDHPDCYPTMDSLRAAFKVFAGAVKNGVTAAATVPALILTGSASITSYSISEAADWTVSNLEIGPSGSSFTVAYKDVPIGEARLQIPGRHNVENALAALSAAVKATGSPPSVFLPGLASFRGALRRLEVKGTVNGIVIVDDYAHHPSEIAAAVEALAVENGRLRILFQPHTFTRTQALMDDFVQALSAADDVIILDVYAAREMPIPGASGEMLASLLRAQGTDAVWIPDRMTAVAHIVDTASSSDTVVTMGAGDVTELAPVILDRLRRKPHSQPRTGRTDGPSAYLLDGVRMQLEKAGLSRVRAGEPLSRHTSWRIGGAADLFATADSAATLQAAFQTAHDQNIPCLVLGGGSNILVSDEGVDGLVILNRARSIEFEADGEAVVEAGSGVFFAKLANESARRGWAGLEWGVAIPGTVGAGVVNNAGAHHGDVARTLVSAEVVDGDGAVRRFSESDLQFRYRTSLLKRVDGEPVVESDSLVTRAWFRLEPDVEGKSRGLITELMARRLATQPISQPSGGSTFKNTDTASAGSLIEAAGLKGFRVGDAEVSPRHANFVVNRGSARALDVVQLIRHVQAAVHAQAGIWLEPEIQVVGRWPDARPLDFHPPVAGAR